MVLGGAGSFDVLTYIDIDGNYSDVDYKEAVDLGTYIVASFSESVMISMQPGIKTEQLGGLNFTVKLNNDIIPARVMDSQQTQQPQVMSK